MILVTVKNSKTGNNIFSYEKEIRYKYYLQ